MIDLGVVRPGSTIRIPFSTYKGSDGSSLTMTNFSAADILVYKDGSTTERASTSGYTATTDFDAKTGDHVAVIDLSDNTTAGFWAAGSEYLVAIDAVTVDGVTTGGWVARFRIGQRAAIFDTTIATLATQTSFTLTAGPAEDNALVGMWVLIHDVASAVQMSWAIITAYTGSTKTVTLAAAPTFTIAAGDNFSVMDRAPLQPATPGRTLVVDANGLADANTVKVGPTGSGTAQTARDLGTSVLISAGTGTGQLDVTSGVIRANLVQILGSTLTETAGQIAAAFKQFFNVASPTATLNSIGVDAASAASSSATAASNASTAASNASTAASSASTAATNTSTILSRIGSFTGSGVNTILGFFQAIARKTAAITPSDMGGTYDNTTDSLEAQQDAGATLTTAGANAVADALLDRADGVETGETPRQSLRLIRAAAVGKCDGAATSTIHFRDKADSKNRITATVDANGNRSAVSTDAT